MNGGFAHFKGWDALNQRRGQTGAAATKRVTDRNRERLVELEQIDPVEQSESGTWIISSTFRAGFKVSCIGSRRFSGPRQNIPEHFNQRRQLARI